MKMCPACHEPLIAFELHGIEIDHCPACLGTWLDSGELEQIAELAQVDGAKGSAALQASGRGAACARRCPRCRRKLRTVTVNGMGVEIERCPHDDGLWFDAGELRKLIECCAGEQAGAVAAFLADLFRWELKSGPDGEQA
jgi:Zn-finger nucleic acid-binding protein